MDKVLDSALLSSANKRKGILAIGAHPDDIELGKVRISRSFLPKLTR